MTDPYEILGLSKDAPIQDVRKAYKLYVSKLHPDKHNGDPFFDELIKKINEAYTSICNGHYNRSTPNPASSSESYELNRLKAEIDNIKKYYLRELEQAHYKICSQSNTINELQLKVLSQHELLKKSHSNASTAYGCLTILIVFGFGVMGLIGGWISDSIILIIYIVVLCISIAGNITRILRQKNIYKHKL